MGSTSEIFDDEEPSVRLKAVEAIISLDTKDEIETFYKILNDDDPDVRAWAGEYITKRKEMR